jgi:hypothetical protein
MLGYVNLVDQIRTGFSASQRNIRQSSRSTLGRRSLLTKLRGRGVQNHLGEEHGRSLVASSLDYSARHRIT